MLYLDSPVEIGRVTLFRDYSNVNRYYYLPNSPRLAMEAGEPKFELLIYRRDITDNPLFKEGDRPGGGFLTMTVDLGISEEAVKAIRAQLRRRTGTEVDLAPVPLDTGTVRVTTLGRTSGADDQGRTSFVEKILGATSPSLYGDNRAVFSIELDHEGAQLMRASLADEGDTQIAVVYELTYAGLLPAYECHIEIHAAQAYHHLRDRFRISTLAFKSDVDREMESLRQSEVITVREVNYLQLTPEQLTARQATLQQLVKDLATWSFFKPGLRPGTVLAADRGGDLAPADPTAAAAAITAGFSTPLRVALTGEGRSGPGAAMVTGATDRQGGIAGQNPTTNAANPSGGGGAAAAPTDENGGISPAVAAWNRAGRPQATWQIRELTQTETQDIVWDLAQVTSTTRTISPQGSIRTLEGASQMASRIKEIDLNNPFFERMAGSVGTSADLAAVGVTSMLVKVRYGFRQDGSFPQDNSQFPITQTGTAGRFDYFLDRRLTPWIEVETVVRHKPGFAIGDDTPEVTTGWVRTTDRDLDIDPVRAGRVITATLTAADVDWDAVKSVTAVVRYTESGLNGERTLLLDREHADASVPIRPKDPARDQWSVQTTWRYDGFEDAVEYHGRGSDRLVLNQPTGRAVPIRIELRDPLVRYKRAVVELISKPAGGEEQRGTVEMTAEQPSRVWTVHRLNVQTPVSVAYKVTLFHQDGSTTQVPEVTTTERQLLVGDIFAGTLLVKVRVIGGVAGNLSDSGYDLCKLTLSYPDAPPAVDAREDFLLEGKPAVVEWRVPKTRFEADKYTFRAEFVGADGTTRVLEGTSTDELLLLRIPPAGS